MFHFIVLGFHFLIRITKYSEITNYLNIEDLVRSVSQHVSGGACIPTLFSMCSKECFLTAAFSKKKFYFVPVPGMSKDSFVFSCFLVLFFFFSFFSYDTPCHCFGLLFALSSSKATIKNME